MHTIYVLQSSKDGNLYIGCTSNLEKRLNAHSRGEVRSTRHRRPWQLVHKEEFQDKHEAYFTEWFYKTAKGKKELKEKIYCPIV